MNDDFGGMLEDLGFSLFTEEENKEQNKQKEVKGMKINVGSGNSQWLNKNSDVENGTVLKIADGGEMVVSKFKNPDGSEKMNYNFLVELPSGEVKKATLNPSTLRNLASAYGDETSEWVGKEVEVEVGRTPAGAKALYLFPKK